MPRRSRSTAPPPTVPLNISPGDLVNHLESLPVEYAAVIVEILQKRVEARRAAFKASVQQQPLMPRETPAPSTPPTPAPAAAPARRRGRAAVPLVPPQDTVGDDADLDNE